ncbi:MULTISPECIES: carbohydrate kinase family protein [unclassified Mesorhizobium]|uniref:carbohydrate kinase family protein n=1 Tax=unclassified Mesorhizobium TaxID=325217 RepID=UPI000FCAA6E2|nr:MULTISPECIES: carbohydrate kinase family protein [unclassified Mesorhizobium]TGP26477.1 carbohydrate kinase [Mesorhizobium sp. M1D.F.Ca.ET.231.01.1.1]TGP38435.1 carbohydrate kinase [Mesorhizobium sp. M1D.F.Ca.ET.234.01.1.1]TGS50645.1 carbohydrate kinase [Mesorhizobium sp. M1D.F.Ca.ET.184.01.1.1]TGS66530.1 carbohydrate kinase [Mesorhizobium sp. M1D.F.Ca.ET.183.01.1.1]
MPTSPKILALGGAHIDRRGQVSGTYVPAASNPGIMREDVGGGVFNALRSLVKRGVSASLLSVRGGDAAAETVAAAIAGAGIDDLSVVFLDRTTPSYTALIDGEGELIVGFADMGLYDLAFPKQLRRAKVREAIAGVDAILCDANLPTAALERLVAQAGGMPVFAIAISPAKVVRLAPLLGDLSLLFMNRREAAALAGADMSGRDLVDALKRLGLAAGVITAGSAPVLGFDQSGVFAIDPPAPRQVADVTGAGDALTGATVAALLRGLPLRAALREGVAAAMLAIESAEAVPSFTAASFAQALALVPEAREVA